MLCKLGVKAPSQELSCGLAELFGVAENQH